MDTKTVLALVQAQPTDYPPAFPPCWKGTSIGKALIAASQLAGHTSWPSTPEPFKVQMRHAYQELLQVEAQPSSPPEWAEVRGFHLFATAFPHSDFKIGEPYLPEPLREILTTTVSSDVETRALLGDALHGWDIRSIFSVLDLHGPERNQWLTWFASNKHQATYLCRLMGVPLPASDRGLHNAGTWFECFYVVRRFRRSYLESVFGMAFAAIAKQTLLEVA
jgi:hypothetical protein